MTSCLTWYHCVVNTIYDLHTRLLSCLFDIRIIDNSRELYFVIISSMRSHVITVYIYYIHFECTLFTYRITIIMLVNTPRRRRRLIGLFILFHINHINHVSVIMFFFWKILSHQVWNIVTMIVDTFGYIEINFCPIQIHEVSDIVIVHFQGSQVVFDLKKPVRVRVKS